MNDGIAPMEARSAAGLPEDDGWWFEPKWDGFRCLSFDHVSGGRFRHGTRLLRFRPDKAPDQCRMDQIA